MSAARIRKQMPDLTVADLHSHPIWEFASDEEGVEGQDETTVRPHRPAGDLDPEGGGQFLVLTSFVLADGTQLQGHITPSRNVSAVAHPYIITNRGPVGFWQGTLVPSPAEIAGNYAKLGKESPAQVFPIQFVSEVPLVGGPARGEISGFMVLKRDGSVAVLA